MPVDAWVRYRRAAHDMRTISRVINAANRRAGRLCISVTIPSQRGRLPSHQQIPLQMLETRLPVARTSSPITDPRSGKKPPPEGLRIKKTPSKTPPLRARTERIAQTASARLLMRSTIHRMRG